MNLSKFLPYLQMQASKSATSFGAHSSKPYIKLSFDENI